MNSVRFNLKRMLIAVLCLSTVMGTALYTAGIGSPTPVKAASVSEYQQYIKDLEAEQKEIQAEIDRLNSDKADQNSVKRALQRKIDNLKSQINACNRQISDLDSQIVQCEEDIKTKNQQLEDTKYTFRQRLRAIYMSGGISASALAVFLDAENLEELLTKTELTNSISAYDSAIMNNIINDMKAIEQSKVKINELKAEQESLKVVINGKKKELDADMKKINSEISNLNSEIGDLKDQVEKLESAIEEYEDAIKNAQHVGSNQTHDGEFLWPCPGHYNISSKYGYRIHPISHKRKFHKGIDIAGGNIKGKPIIAAADGIVSLATYNSGGYGYYVMINHGRSDDGNYYNTLYAHMTKYIVKSGQYVKKGQTIGYVGTSGASTGYHLHFEVRVGKKNSKGNVVYETTNPMSYF